MVSYGLILLVAVIVLATRHYDNPRVPRNSKWSVVGGVGISLVISSLVPSLFMVAMLFQVGVCVYIILYNYAAKEVATADEFKGK